MHKNDFVLAVKDRYGKVLREDNNRVFMPFYEEYKLLLKNKNDRKAQVEIEIDGMDIADGTKFLIDPNGHINLERFVRNGNLKDGQCFKFVPADHKDVTDPGSSDNGLVKVKFRLEKKKDNGYVINHWHPTTPMPYYYDSNCPPIWTNDTYNNVTYKMDLSSTSCSSRSGTPKKATLSSCDLHCGGAASSLSLNDGATVGGSDSDQKFRYGNISELEDKETVLTLRIVQVEKSITVDRTRNKFCPECGEKLKFAAKFCTLCGNKQE